ncbi:MAG: hydrolase [Verrucomicrobiales bacterium]|nr:hydrolase [Verrucomicrobiales bacterium]
MIQPWKKLSSKHAGDFRIFTIRSDVKISPRTSREHDFYVIDAVNWVNVLAITTEKELVMVEQFRHGSETVELEIPGGMIDKEDVSPLEAGLRELKEETGYEGVNGRIIGKVYPNPAIMSNTCYTVLVENCVKKHEISLDSGEDLLTMTVPLGQLDDLVRSGKIGHSLVAVALYHLDLWRRKPESMII